LHLPVIELAVPVAVGPRFDHDAAEQALPFAGFPQSKRDARMNTDMLGGLHLLHFELSAAIDIHAALDPHPAERTLAARGLLASCRQMRR
jgi:hypothetical protein